MRDWIRLWPAIRSLFDSSTSFSSSTPTHHELEDDEDCISDDSGSSRNNLLQLHHCESSDSSTYRTSSSIREVDLMPAEAICDLQAIAMRMIAAGYLRECIQVYGSVRKSSFDSSFRKLGIEKLSIGDVQRLEWEALEGKIRRWIRAARVCVRILFASEKKLCEQIFDCVHPLKKEKIKERKLQFFVFLILLCYFQFLSADAKIKEGLVPMTTSLSRDLIFLILQFLDEEKFKETVHILQKESGLFFSMNYFEDLILDGKWEEVERYLSGFTRVDDNRYSMKIFFEIRKQKYLEALDKHDRAMAVKILAKDLKVFSSFNEDLFREITQLLTLDNFRENEQLSTYRDAKTARTIMLGELKKLIEANPLFL